MGTRGKLRAWWWLCRNPLTRGNGVRCPGCTHTAGIPEASSTHPQLCRTGNKGDDARAGLGDHRDRPVPHGLPLLPVDLLQPPASPLQRVCGCGCLSRRLVPPCLCLLARELTQGLGAVWPAQGPPGLQSGWAQPSTRLLPWWALRPDPPGFGGRGGSACALTRGPSPLHGGAAPGAPRGRTQSFQRPPWSGDRDRPVFTICPGLLRTGLPGQGAPGPLGKVAQLLGGARRSLEGEILSSGCPGPLGTGFPLCRGAPGPLGTGAPGPIQGGPCPFRREPRTLREGALPVLGAPRTLLTQVLWLRFRRPTLLPAPGALGQLQPSLNLLAEVS